jgi:hypothetical protein
MAQTFIEGLKPEFKNEMIKTSWVSIAQAFDELEQKAQAATKINETYGVYRATTTNRGNQGAQQGLKE